MEGSEGTRQAQAGRKRRSKREQMKERQADAEAGALQGRGWGKGAVMGKRRNGRNGINSGHSLTVFRAHCRQKCREGRLPVSLHQPASPLWWGRACKAHQNQRA